MLLAAHGSKAEIERRVGGKEAGIANVHCTLMQKPSVYVIYLLYITHIYIAITGGGRFYPSRATIFPKTISFMKRHCSKSFSFPFPSVYLVRSAWWKPSSH